MREEEIFDRIFNGVYEDCIKDLNNLDKAYDLLPLVVRDEMSKEEMREEVIGDYLEKTILEVIDWCKKNLRSEE